MSTSSRSKFAIVIGEYMSQLEKKGKLTTKLEDKLYDWFENYHEQTVKKVKE